MVINSIYTYIWYGIRRTVVVIFIGVAVHQAAFGQGTGPVLLSYVTCTGTESSLLSCSRTDTYLHRCSHFYDAGVVCPPCKLFSFFIEFFVYMLVQYIHHQYLCLQYNARLLYCHDIDILAQLFATHIQLRVWPMRLLDRF